MVAQTKDVTKDASDKTQEHKDGGFKVPPDFRKSKVEQVMSLLEREYVMQDLHTICSHSRDTFTDVICL